MSSEQNLAPKDMDMNESSSKTKELETPQNKIITSEKREDKKPSRWKFFTNFFKCLSSSQDRCSKENKQSEFKQKSIIISERQLSHQSSNSNKIDSIYKQDNVLSEILGNPIGMQKVCIDPKGYLNIQMQFGRLVSQESEGLNQSDLCLSLISHDLFTLIVSNDFDESVIKSALKLKQQVVYCLLDSSPSKQKQIMQSTISKKVELIACDSKSLGRALNLDQFETIVLIPSARNTNSDNQNKVNHISEETQNNFIQKSLEGLLEIVQKHLQKTIVMLKNQFSMEQIKSAIFNKFNDHSLLDQLNLGVKITEIYNNDLMQHDSYALTFCSSYHLLAIQNISDIVFSFLIGTKKGDVQADFSTQEYTTHIQKTSLSVIMKYLTEVNEANKGQELYAFRTFVIDQLLKNNIIPSSFVPHIIQECILIDQQLKYTLKLTKEQKDLLKSNILIKQSQEWPQLPSKQENKSKNFKFRSNNPSQNKQYNISFLQYFQYRSHQYKPDNQSQQNQALPFSPNSMSPPQSYESHLSEFLNPSPLSYSCDQQYTSTMEHSFGKLLHTKKYNQSNSQSSLKPQNLKAFPQNQPSQSMPQQQLDPFTFSQ